MKLSKKLTEVITEQVKKYKFKVYIQGILEMMGKKWSLEGDWEKHVEEKYFHSMRYRKLNVKKYFAFF